MAEKKLRTEPLRLIERQIEWVPQDQIDELPKALRGIYVLYREEKNPEKPRLPFRNVVYVGMSANGIKGRLRSHRKNKSKEWDCCSIFSVWPNVREDEIRELEGILRHIFRRDKESQKMNAQGVYQRLLNTKKLVLEESNKNKVDAVERDSASFDVQSGPELSAQSRVKKSPEKKRERIK